MSDSFSPSLPRQSSPLLSMDQASGISHPPAELDQDESMRSRTSPSTVSNSNEHSHSLTNVEAQYPNETSMNHDSHEATNLQSTSPILDPSPTSETTNTTSKEDDSFISQRLANEIEKAQLSFGNPDVSEAEDDSSLSERNVATRKRSLSPALPGDTRTVRTRVEIPQTLQVPSQDLQAHSHPQVSSTTETSSKAAAHSTPEMPRGTEEDSDSTTIHATVSNLYPVSNQGQGTNIQNLSPSTVSNSNEHSHSLTNIEAQYPNETSMNHDSHDATNLQSTSPILDPSPTSETTNTTSKEDDSFISERLANEIEKAQLSLGNPDVSEAEDDSSLSERNGATRKRSLSPALSGDMRNVRTRFEIPQTLQVPSQDHQAHSHPLVSSTTETSSKAAAHSTPEMPRSSEEDSDSTTIHATVSNLYPVSNQGQGTNIQKHHHQVSSPGIAAPRMNVTSGLEDPSTSTQSTELMSEKKPLSASTALPVYHKLIAALEEARLSDCLTDPMADDLKKLIFRCKKTGTAIIKHLPLPPEDNVIIILDADDEDLATKYGVSLDFFDSPDNGCEGSPHRPSWRPTITQGALSPNPHEVPQHSTQMTNSQRHHPESVPQKHMLESTPMVSQLSETHINESSAMIGLPSEKHVRGSTLTVSRSEHSKTNSRNTIDPLTQAQHLEFTPSVSHTACSEDPIKKSSIVFRQRPREQTVASTAIFPQSTQPDNRSKDSSTITDSQNAKAQPTHTRELRARKKKNEEEAIPECADGNPAPQTLTVQDPINKNLVSKTGIVRETAADEGMAQNVVHRHNKHDGQDHESTAPGSAAIEKELKELLSPYSSHQTPKRAKLIAWESLSALLKRRRLGEPLDQVFLDSIDGGINSVLIKTRFNAQTWYEAIEQTMPKLFNSHEGEPAYASGFFNTSVVKNESLADKVPKGVPTFWHHTWRSMRMCIRPSSTRVSSFLKILLDSVLLTGKTFLKEPPVSEHEKAMTGVNAVCQAMNWLNSQRASKADNSRTMRLLDSNNLDSTIDIGVIQHWQDLFIKVLDSYVAQYFEANYILNDEANEEDKAVAIRFKKERKGDSIKPPTLAYLTMFACCGIRGLICCSNDVNVAPAGQMLSFAVLSEWLSKQRPDFQVKEPIFKRSNQMLMKLIDGLFDKDGHFIKPEITWYDIAKNLCFDYLSHWFLEAGELSEDNSLVFPKSSVFSSKDQIIKFSNHN